MSVTLGVSTFGMPAGDHGRGLTADSDGFSFGGRCLHEIFAMMRLAELELLMKLDVHLFVLCVSLANSLRYKMLFLLYRYYIVYSRNASMLGDAKSNRIVL